MGRNVATTNRLDGRGNITKEVVAGTTIPNGTTSLAYDDAAEL